MVLTAMVPFGENHGGRMDDRQLFERSVCACPDRGWPAARCRVLMARLDDDLSPETLCRAIDAAAVNDFYQGRTPKQAQRINTLGVICKDRDRVLRLASAAGPNKRRAPAPVPQPRRQHRVF